MTNLYVLQSTGRCTYPNDQSIKIRYQEAEDDLIQATHSIYQKPESVCQNLWRSGLSVVLQEQTTVRNVGGSQFPSSATLPTALIALPRK